MRDTAPSGQGRRDRFAFDRSDRWGLGLLLALVVLARAVVDLGLPAWRWSRGEPILVPFLSPVQVPQLDAAGVGHGPAVYEVELADPSTGLRIAELVPGAVSLLLTVAAAWLVLRVMRTVASGDPFGRRVVTQLRALAGVLVIGAPVLFFVQLPVHASLLGRVDLGGLDPALALDVPWEQFLAGFVVAMLAEAFRVGQRLRADVDGLV